MTSGAQALLPPSGENRRTGTAARQVLDGGAAAAPGPAKSSDNVGDRAAGTVAVILAIARDDGRRVVNAVIPFERKDGRDRSEDKRGREKEWFCMWGLKTGRS